MSNGFGGKSDRKGAAKTSLKYSTTSILETSLPIDQWPEYIASIRTSWLETPDQALPFGQDLAARIKNSETSIATFLWEDLSGAKHKVLREKITVSGESVHSLNAGPIARRVEDAVDKAMAKDPVRGVQPPFQLARFRMAQIMLRPSSKGSESSKLYQYLNSKTGQNGKDKSKHFPEAWNEAQDSLWRKPETWDAVRKEYEERSEKEEQAMQDIQKAWHPRETRTEFEQYDRDDLASTDQSILARVPDDVIYLLVDTDDKVLAFRWENALQWLYGQAFVDKAAEHITKYVSHQAPHKPQKARHALDRHWCRVNPQFDMDNAKTYPGAAHGVYHFGCGGVMGHRSEPPIIKADSGGNPGTEKYPEIARIRNEMMKEGVFHYITKAHVLIHTIIDPVLLNENVAVMEHYPHVAQPTVRKDPYSLHALLVDVCTTDHLDKSDWVRGLALMSTFGQFTGADLCLRQLGVTMGFGAGAIAAIRGRELNHCTTWWEGEHRYSVVNVCQQHMRDYAAVLDKRQAEEEEEGDRDGDVDGGEEVQGSQEDGEADDEEVGRGSRVDYAASLLTSRKRAREPEGEDEGAETPLKKQLRLMGWLGRS